MTFHISNYCVEQSCKLNSSWKVQVQLQVLWDSLKREETFKQLQNRTFLDKATLRRCRPLWVIIHDKKVFKREYSLSTPHKNRVLNFFRGEKPVRRCTVSFLTLDSHPNPLVCCDVQWNSKLSFGVCSHSFEINWEFHTQKMKIVVACWRIVCLCTFTRWWVPAPEGFCRAAKGEEIFFFVTIGSWSGTCPSHSIDFVVSFCQLIIRFRWTRTWTSFWTEPFVTTRVVSISLSFKWFSVFREFQLTFVWHKVCDGKELWIVFRKSLSYFVFLLQPSVFNAIVQSSLNQSILLQNNMNLKQAPASTISCS